MGTQGGVGLVRTGPSKNCPRLFNVVTFVFVYGIYEKCHLKKDIRIISYFYNTKIPSKKNPKFLSVNGGVHPDVKFTVLIQFYSQKCQVKVKLMFLFLLSSLFVLGCNCLCFRAAWWCVLITGVGI